MILSASAILITCVVMSVRTTVVFHAPHMYSKFHGPMVHRPLPPPPPHPPHPAVLVSPFVKYPMRPLVMLEPRVPHLGKPFWKPKPRRVLLLRRPFHSKRRLFRPRSRFLGQSNDRSMLYPERRRPIVRRRMRQQIMGNVATRPFVRPLSAGRQLNVKQMPAARGPLVLAPKIDPRGSSTGKFSTMSNKIGPGPYQPRMGRILDLRGGRIRDRLNRNIGRAAPMREFSRNGKISRNAISRKPGPNLMKLQEPPAKGGKISVVTRKRGERIPLKGKRGIISAEVTPVKTAPAVSGGNGGPTGDMVGSVGGSTLDLASGSSISKTVIGPILSEPVGKPITSKPVGGPSPVDAPVVKTAPLKEPAEAPHPLPPPPPPPPEVVIKTGASSPHINEVNKIPPPPPKPLPAEILMTDPVKKPVDVHGTPVAVEPAPSGKKTGGTGLGADLEMALREALKGSGLDINSLASQLSGSTGSGIIDLSSLGAGSGVSGATAIAGDITVLGGDLANALAGALANENVTGAEILTIDTAALDQALQGKQASGQLKSSAFQSGNAISSQDLTAGDVQIIVLDNADLNNLHLSGVDLTALTEGNTGSTHQRPAPNIATATNVLGPSVRQNIETINVAASAPSIESGVGTVGEPVGTVPMGATQQDAIGIFSVPSGEFPKIHASVSAIPARVSQMLEASKAQRHSHA